MPLPTLQANRRSGAHRFRDDKTFTVAIGVFFFFYTLLAFLFSFWVITNCPTYLIEAENDSVVEANETIFFEIFYVY